MSQRTEKIRRQVDQLRADVDALQAVWLAQEHHAAAELEASAERARQAHRRAREAKAIAQTWRRNAILALILAGLTGCVALAIVRQGHRGAYHSHGGRSCRFRHWAAARG